MSLACPRPERCQWCREVGPCAWVMWPPWCLCVDCGDEFETRRKERSSWG